MIDIYFDSKYGRLYEKVEGGSCEIFDFNHMLGKVRHMYIKREIPGHIDGSVYYDIVTPYGYGGPVITGSRPECRQELVREFKKAFSRHCSHQRIVSEFIRFHPLLDNARDFKKIYDVQLMRPTVGTNLLAHEDPVAEELSKTTRKNIRRALREGVKYRVIENPDNLEAFKDIYYTTMKRKNADDYYFFGDDYFDELANTLGDHLLVTEALYNGKIIGMTLTFKYNKLLHTHLSGTYEDFHHLYPVYIMQYATIRWGKERGYHLLHGGGGLTNSLNDSLYLFKKQFGKHQSFGFQVGKKVWNPEVYSKLCEAANVNLESDFFPAYRAKVGSKV